MQSLYWEQAHKDHQAQKITPTTYKLQDIHANLWESYNLPLILGKTYIGLLPNEFTQKS